MGPSEKSIVRNQNLNLNGAQKSGVQNSLELADLIINLQAICECQLFKRMVVCYPEMPGAIGESVGRTLLASAAKKLANPNTYHKLLGVPFFRKARNMCQPAILSRQHDNSKLTI